MVSVLASLKTRSIVVADTGDINAILELKPRDATTNPSLILAAAKDPKFRDIVVDVLNKECQKSQEKENVIAEAIDSLNVEIGHKILGIIEGRVSTEVDARLSYDTEATLTKARKLIKMYGDKGHGKERVLIKVAATWEGIKAAEILEKEGIHCNLTLLFGFEQAVACAEAGVKLISPFVGRILDWYKNNGHDVTVDPGVVSVSQIYNYYKKFGYNTEIMGASFRNVGEIQDLCGCDLLTISPKLLNDMAAMEGEIATKLSPEEAMKEDLVKITVPDQAAFNAGLDNCQMAKEQLTKGIEGFSKAMVDLEELLAETLKETKTA